MQNPVGFQSLWEGELAVGKEIPLCFAITIPQDSGTKCKTLHGHFCGLSFHCPPEANRNSWFKSHCEFEVVLWDFPLQFAGDNVLGISQALTA